MTSPLKKTSIIIPIADKETAYSELFKDLKKVSQKSQILFVLPYSLRKQKIHKDLLSYQHCEVIFSKKGRAFQMNAGAQKAKGEYLWFLHADSRLNSKALTSLEKALKNHPHHFIYFRLKFLDDGPKLMFINNWGCFLRSHILGVPFGDQGFCLSKKNFIKLKGYDTKTPFGEDHLLIWKAKQNKIPFKPLKAFIRTSPRKYQQYGWLKITLKHAYLWPKQALPEVLKLIGAKL